MCLSVLLLLLFLWILTESILFTLHLLGLFNFTLPGDHVLTRLLVQLSLHKHIEEESNGSLVCQLERDVHSPEEWMRGRVLNIRERD